MLSRLEIQNIALIKSQSIEFHNGFSVFSGETGAGKSLVIDSLNLVLGARADKSLISVDADFAVVEAVFEKIGEKTIEKLFNFGFDEEDDSLIIFRKMFSDGRNDCRINGRSVTVGMLKDLASTLVDVYGQFENQTMFKNSSQLNLIDNYCKNKKLLVELDFVLDKIADIDKKLETSVGDDKERERLLDLLAFQIDEIESANFFDGEEEELKEKHKMIISKEKFIDSLSSCLQALDDPNFSVLDNIKKAERSLMDISNFESEIEKLIERISDIKFEFSDIVDELHSWFEKYSLNDIDVDFVEARLDLLNNFKKKYGQSIQEINEFCESAKIRFEELKNNKEFIEALKNEREKQIFQAEEICDKLHAARVNVVAELKESISRELIQLGMQNAMFDMLVEKLDKINRSGKDLVTFMFSANAGIEPKPLSKVVSGGELSRFMLALKSVLGKSAQMPTMIFDEIDSGISGQIGKIVGQKLFQISLDSQVLCVSHLAQIVCLADHNYLIKKFEDKDSTKTNVFLLDENQKVEEVVRLVGGEQDSAHAKMLAVDLIQSANYFKRSFN